MAEEHVGVVEPETAAPKAAPLPLWRNRDYMLLLSGQIGSTLGSTVSGIAFPLLILAITNSPTAAGIAGALVTIPYMIFGLPAGALVDRWDRKRVMLICDTIRAINMATIPIAIWLNVISVWQIYIVSVIEGTAFVFFNLAEVAALPRVVDKAQLPAAMGQNQGTQATATLIGPSLGGFLFGTVGRAVPFLFDALSYALSAATLFLIRREFQLKREATAQRNLRGEIGEGLRWLWSQPIIRFVALITGGLNLALASSGLLLIVLAQQMGANETEIGAVFSIGAVGGIAGALVASWFQKRFPFGKVIIASIVALAITFPFYAVAGNILLLGLVSAVVFVTGPIYSVASVSYRLALIPDQLQGRVNSAFRLVAFGFQPIGSTLAGFLLERFGAVPAVLVFSGVLFVVALASIAYPGLRNEGNSTPLADAAHGA